MQAGWQSPPVLKPGSHSGLAESDAATVSVALFSWPFARFKGNQVRVTGSAGPDGGLADVYLDGEKQLVPVDCWNPAARNRQVLSYRSGLAPGAHTLKRFARGAGNPLSQGARGRVHSVQYSAAQGSANYQAGGGPRSAQRMILGYTGRTDYFIVHRQAWRPAIEMVTRGRPNQDTVSTFWRTHPAAGEISGTPDPELYRYGVHGCELRVNLTVGSGRYYARLKFAATRTLPAQPNSFDIRINGRRRARSHRVRRRSGWRRPATGVSIP